MSVNIAKEYNKKLTFSGHDTFHCRQLWLKKGYDFVKNGNKFSQENAVIVLGVGKNMVTAIQYWMKAFGLIDRQGNTTEIADYIFDNEKGRDPFLEDNATLWLLHYHLVSENYASTYYYVFNELRKEKIEFTKSNFISFIERKYSELGEKKFNEQTVATDFEVFLKIYNKTEGHINDKEDTFSGLLSDLNLISVEKRKMGDTTTVYFAIPNDARDDIPLEIILYTILNNSELQISIGFNSIYHEKNRAGSVFAITKSDLFEKLQDIASNVDYERWKITLDDHAGIKELQIKVKPNKFEVLDNYYNG